MRNYRFLFEHNISDNLECVFTEIAYRRLKFGDKIDADMKAYGEDTRISSLV